MKRAPRDPDPAKRWLAFLRNHREAIAAMDSFTVPAITFGVLYCFFVISHDRRRFLHVNVTKHPTSGWITPQLREAFPFRSTAKFLIFDRDAKYGRDLPAAVRSLEMNPARTSFRSPSLRSSRLVRIHFPPILKYICALHAHTGPSPESFRVVLRRGSYSGLLYQQRYRSWSRLRFWRTTGSRSHLRSSPAMHCRKGSIPLVL
jgi:hypothetical protein